MQGESIAIKKSLIQINVCVLLLGGTSLFAKLINLPADTITLYRSVFGFLTLLLIILLTRSGTKKQSGRDFFFLILTGLLTGGHWVSFFHGIQISTVALGILSLYTFPIITSFLEPLFEREKIQIGTILRAIIVFLGLLLIVPEFEMSNQASIGVFWGLLSAVFFSVRNIMVRKTLSHISGIKTMCYQLAVITILLLPFVSLKQNITLDNRLLLLLVLGIFFTAAPHVLLVSSLQHIKATSASLILCLHPMYSIIFAIIFLSEVPTIKVILGGLIIVGVSVYESIRVARQ